MLLELLFKLKFFIFLDGALESIRCDSSVLSFGRHNFKMSAFFLITAMLKPVQAKADDSIRIKIQAIQIGKLAQ